MEAEYRCSHDGLQWVLYRTADVEIKKDHKPTGDIGRKESIIGYFPKIGQAAERMFEMATADKISEFDIGDKDKILNAVFDAKSEVMAEVERAMA